MKKLIIIGSGPAGVSAALYAKRANVDVEVISLAKSSLIIAHKIDNYYGSNLSGPELFEKGLSQLQEFNIPLHKEEVIAIEWNGDFIITTDKNTYEAGSVILATGAYRNAPAIRNIKNYEGKGLSYCATCDGFFYRKKRVVVLGNSTYATHEAEYLSNLTSELTILTNGKEVEDDKLNQFNVITTKVKELVGEEHIEKIIFADDSEIEVDGMFVAEGVAGSADLARKLGVLVDQNNKIEVNENMMTNIPGLYAVGDATKGILQVSKAVYEGALAGTDVIKYLKNK